MTTRPATFSFELFPPRTAAGEAVFVNSLEHLVAAEPEFISVTYGANGSTRGSSLNLLLRLLGETDISPMAHLTCVGSSYAETSRLIREFLDAGIMSFLALRGDPPEGSTESDDFLGDIRSAGELVQLIHRVQAERAQFSQLDVPGFPQAKRLGDRERVTIAVAAFPNGHPRSRSVEQDIDTLLAKEAAGANLAITQLFFYGDQYARFVEQARSAGVTMRILPGIMPGLSSQRLRRILDLTDEPMPTDLLARLEAETTPEGQAAVGIEHAIALSRDVFDLAATADAAPGVHLYTFNRHEAVLEVLRGAGVFDVPASAYGGCR